MAGNFLPCAAVGLLAPALLQAGVFFAACAARRGRVGLLRPGHQAAQKFLQLRRPFPGVHAASDVHVANELRGRPDLVHVAIHPFDPRCRRGTVFPGLVDDETTVSRRSEVGRPAVPDKLDSIGDFGRRDESLGVLICIP